jgi:hypothetical protein
MQTSLPSDDCLTSRRTTIGGLRLLDLGSQARAHSAAPSRRDAKANLNLASNATSTKMMAVWKRDTLKKRQLSFMPFSGDFGRRLSLIATTTGIGWRILVACRGNFREK